MVGGGGGGNRWLVVVIIRGGGGNRRWWKVVVGVGGEWFETSWIMIHVQIMGTGHVLQVLGMIQERIDESVFPNK
ncbi:hypothetical protein C5167_012881 [Papaver somniferum]|uniref:Uncharacterized protein n=1 Tax=Papaver somniferum TaxID=3469 RepID=A0A4Y7IZJ7_PAPSO|nr:hypothetical protein C5167_012881 [Papaver somniferum]